MRICFFYDTVDRIILDLAISIIYHVRINNFNILELENASVFKGFLKKIIKL